jgi:hypothetical protein
LRASPLPPWKPNGGKKHNGGQKPDSRGASSRKPQLGPIVATYDYTDESGTVLSQAVRYEEPKKDFRQ